MTLNLLEYFPERELKSHLYGIESHGLELGDVVSFFQEKYDFGYVYQREFSVLKIADVHAVRNLVHERSDKKRLFVISFLQTNREAQNALLKTIEEPSSNTYFIFIFPQAKKILETVRSRMHIIHAQKIINTSKRFIILDDYLQLTLSGKFDFHKKVLAKSKKDSVHFFSKKDLLLFLDDLEVYFVKQKGDMHKRQFVLSEIFVIRDYLSVPSLSMKMILDSLAVAIHAVD